VINLPVSQSEREFILRHLSSLNCFSCRHFAFEETFCTLREIELNETDATTPVYDAGADCPDYEHYQDSTINYRAIRLFYRELREREIAEKQVKKKVKYKISSLKKPRFR